MRINLLFGFLGSGKTTLARRLLAAQAGERKMAVIVNEFGEVGIDGAILEGRNVDVVELTSGCLCCTLKGPLLDAVAELKARGDVDHVVIEATGIAEPEEMIETFSDPAARQGYEMGPMVTVIDAAKFARLRDMLGEFYLAQVQNADVLLLNKIDLAAAGDLEATRAEVARLNPEAEILFTERCDVEPRRLLGETTSAVLVGFEAAAAGGSPGREGQAHAPGGHAHRHAPATSFVLGAEAAVSRAALEGFYAGLPAAVWRSKGFVVVDGEPSLVQFAMADLEITPSGPRRFYHLVFIGRDLDRAEIEGRWHRLSGIGA